LAHRKTLSASGESYPNGVVAQGFSLWTEKFVTASELANTLYGGRFRQTRRVNDAARRNVRLTFTDGAGIPDIESFDWLYTGTGLGLGLGGAKRLSNRFDLSRPGEGTRVTITRWGEKTDDLSNQSCLSSERGLEARRNPQAAQKLGFGETARGDNEVWLRNWLPTWQNMRMEKSCSVIEHEFRTQCSRFDRGAGCVTGAFAMAIQQQQPGHRLGAVNGSPRDRYPFDQRQVHGESSCGSGRGQSSSPPVSLGRLCRCPVETASATWHVNGETPLLILVADGLATGGCRRPQWAVRVLKVILT
jgi:serine/threonine-protein kinase RsbT